MSFFKYFLCIFLFLSISEAQESNDLPENIENQKVQVEASLQNLQNAIDNPGSGDRDFLPALAVPVAVNAISELLFLTMATGFISMTLRDETLAEINTDAFRALSAQSTLFALRAISGTLDSAVERTLSNVKKLKEDGYTNTELESLASRIATKERQCKNSENNNSPNNFCPSFKTSFGRSGYQIESRSGGYLVKKGGKFACCIEWDSLHCGFEIFDKKGHHKGEVGCLEDEYDPCRNNLARGTHARPQKDHKPRSSSCQK